MYWREKKKVSNDALIRVVVTDAMVREREREIESECEVPGV